MVKLNPVRLVALAACLAIGPPALSAQTLRGTVLDSESGEPVMLAYVGLLAEGQELVVASLANSSGAFSLQAPEPGSYFLYVTRTGYETLMDGVFDLGQDGVFDMRVGLKPSPISLEPLLVSAAREASPLEEVGFYDRATMGRGTFLIREEIQRMTADRVSDALRRIPLLDVDESRPLIGGPDVMQNPGLVVRQGAYRCSPTLYVDGAVVAFGGNDRMVRPDDYVSLTDIDAIEVYTRTSEVPVTFDAIGNCGVVLLWTRRR